jgi:hypothetical protein
VARKEIGRHRRKKHREVVDALVGRDEPQFEEEPLETDVAHPLEESAATGGSAGFRWLLFVGCALIVAAIGVGLLFVVGDHAGGGGLVGRLGDIGVNPAYLVLLGIGLVVAGAVLERVSLLEGEAGREMIRGLNDVSERMQSLFEGIEGFRDRLEAIRADRVSATLNQVRYEVSSLHEKIHRELMPAANLEEKLDSLEQKVTRFQEAAERDTEGEEIKDFCSSMEEAVRKLNPDLESLRAAVESGASTAGRGLENIVGLVERLEKEIRDLDGKANRILNLSSEVQERIGTLGGDGASRRPSADAPISPEGEGESESADEIDDDAENPEAETAGAATPADRGPESSPSRPDRDYTFRSAIERLKHLRG